MRKKLNLLLAVICAFICCSCVFPACNGSSPSDNPNGVETPVEKPGDEPERPIEPEEPLEPEQPSEPEDPTEPEDPETGGESGGGNGGFQGNPPGNPNKEDVFDAN